jgi:hypothetical protein
MLSSKVKAGCTALGAIVAYLLAACGSSDFVPQQAVDEPGGQNGHPRLGDGGSACGMGPSLVELECGDGGGDAGQGTDATPRRPAACGDPRINTEQGMIVAYAPSNGQSVGQHGRVVVWANDECPPSVAPGERVDPSTGAVTLPGNRTAKLHDGYLAEPALYVAPATAENGGTPFFPTAIRGGFNSSYSPYALGACDCKGGFVLMQDAGLGGLMAPDAGAATLVPMDPPPQGTTLPCFWTAEYVWDVSSLGLTPGAHDIELSIPDGDGDREEACTTILVE